MIPHIRVAAARSIGTMGPVAASAIPDLLEHLRSDTPEVASQAAWSLGALGTSGAASPRVVAALIEALGHRDGEVRRYAAFALSRLGPPAASAIPQLTRALGDRHMAYMAARALGDIGPPARGAIPQITRLLANPDLAARAEGAIALAKLAPLPDETVAMLRTLQNDKEPLVRQSARSALLVIAPPREPENSPQRHEDTKKESQ
jgi:HEAT repeat protein